MKLFSKKRNIELTDQEAQIAAVAAGQTLNVVFAMDTNKDGKTDLGEYLNAIMLVYTSIKTQLGSWKKAFAAFGTDAVRNQIIEGFANGFKIENKEVEAAVEAAIVALDAIWDAADSISAIAKK